MGESLDAIRSRHLFPGIEELWLELPWKGLNKVAHPQRELFFTEIDEIIRSSPRLCRLRFSDSTEVSCKGTIGINLSRGHFLGPSSIKHSDSRRIYETCMSIIQSFISLCLENYSETSSNNDEWRSDGLDLQWLLTRCSRWVPHVSALKVGHKYCCVLPGVPETPERASLLCECGFCFRCRTQSCDCGTITSI